MTALALRLAGHCNGVSRRHGQVARRMWRSSWPDVPEEEVPIGSVTNGVHVPTWVAAEVDNLYRAYVDSEWITHHDDPELWEAGRPYSHCSHSGKPTSCSNGNCCVS